LPPKKKTLREYFVFFIFTRFFSKFGVFWGGIL
jgi:hypothetical protein